MQVERLGRLARTLRVRARLTQAALATRAGVDRRAVSVLECGRARQLRLGVVEAILGALGARFDPRVLWNGPELDRLLDAGHAALGAAVKRQLERWGWLVRVEVSYSRYGERGRIDLLAFHPAVGALLVIELKTELVDVQELLGLLDTKVRLAPRIAPDLGWRPVVVVPVVVFLEHRTTRHRLRVLASLFDRFSLQGRAAPSWLRRPDAGTVPTGLLWFTRTADRSLASRPQPSRVRQRSHRSAGSSTAGAPADADPGVGPAR